MNVDRTNAEPQSHAQFGEDRILAEIFGERVHGYCVEVGANDGRTGSASYLFEKRGWECLLVEPIPALAEEIRKYRACRVVNCAASSREGEATFFVADSVEAVSTLDLTPERAEWIGRVGGTIKEITVRTATLDSLLEEAGFGELDFVTIDVEGHELSVLEGFDLERYRPRIVILEDNSIDGDARVSRHMSRPRLRALQENWRQRVVRTRVRPRADQARGDQEVRARQADPALGPQAPSAGEPHRNARRALCPRVDQAPVEARLRRLGAQLLIGGDGGARRLIPAEAGDDLGAALDHLCSQARLGGDAPHRVAQPLDVVGIDEYRRVARHLREATSWWR